MLKRKGKNIVIADVRRLLDARRAFRKFVAMEMHPAIYVSIVAVNLCLFFGYRELGQAMHEGVVDITSEEGTVSSDAVSSPLLSGIKASVWEADAQRKPEDGNGPESSLLAERKSAQPSTAASDSSAEASSEVSTEGGGHAGKPSSETVIAVRSTDTEQQLPRAGAAMAQSARVHPPELHSSSKAGVRRKKTGRHSATGFVPPPPPGVMVVPPPPDAPSIVSMSSHGAKYHGFLVPPPPPMGAWSGNYSDDGAEASANPFGRASSRGRVKVVTSGNYKRFIVTR